MAVKRLFIAIDLPVEIKKKLAGVQEVLKKRVSDKVIKWVEEENFHLNLFFLGMVEEKKILNIVQRLKQVKQKSFSLQLSGLGFFPSQNEARVIWVGVKNEIDQLKNIHKKIDSVLRELGFDFYREFLPHLALGRVRRGYRISFGENKKVNKLINQGKSFLVDRFVLFESRLSSLGPVYKTVKKFNLKNG